jgi:hypothetical protein
MVSVPGTSRFKAVVSRVLCSEVNTSDPPADVAASGIAAGASLDGVGAVASVRKATPAAVEATRTPSRNLRREIVRCLCFVVFLLWCLAIEKFSPSAQVNKLRALFLM